MPWRLSVVLALASLALTVVIAASVGARVHELAEASGGMRRAAASLSGATGNMVNAHQWSLGPADDGDFVFANSTAADPEPLAIPQPGHARVGGGDFEMGAVRRLSSDECNARANTTRERCSPGDFRCTSLVERARRQCVEEGIEVGGPP